MQKYVSLSYLSKILNENVIISKKTATFAIKTK